MTRTLDRRGPGCPAAGSSALLALALSGMVGLVGMGCPESAPESSPESVQIAAAGPRIVSVSPVATRFLIGLGLEDRILSAVDPSSPEAFDPTQDGPAYDRLARLDPDFVFLPVLPDDRAELAALEAGGARIVEFAPHDLEDLLALLRGIGTELAGEAAVDAFERSRLRPVAMVAGESSPTDRLRAVALVGIDPPELAGGHSVETDLIEIGGATSLTHGADDNRRPIDRDELATMKPDLILVMTETALDPEARERVLDLAAGIAPIVYFEFARETFWLDEPVNEARRMRELIVAAERERRKSSQPPPKAPAA